MHRSGTSLLAGALAAAGVDMGGQLTPGRGNPRGHFEDLDFVRFHDAALARRGAPLFAPAADFQPVLAQDEERAARGLLAARAGKPFWGFKDPRATLFLDTWRALAPEAFFLLLYRHPVEVALSLLRRGLQLDLQLAPERALDAWSAYNARLLAFRRAHPERVLLVSVEALTADLAGALARIAERAGAPLAAELGAGVLEAGELRAGLEARELDWSALAPAATALFAELEEAADLPAPAQPAPRPARGFRDPARDAQFASEHLLAALLARGAGDGGASAERRIDFDRLHLLAAEQAEAAGRAHEDAGVAWGLVRRLRAERDAARALAEEAEGKAQRSAAAAERLREQVLEEEELRRRLDATRGWRLLNAYWRTVRRLSAWRSR